MNEENKVLLAEEIKHEIEHLKVLQYGGQEHALAVESLSKLYKLMIDDEKFFAEHEDKNVQLKESIKDRYFRLGIAAAELLIPLIFYGIWMNRGFKFEEEGTFTSATFRNLFNRFRPTKK